MAEQTATEFRQTYESMASAVGDAAAFAERLRLDAVATILRDAEQAAIRAVPEVEGFDSASASWQAAMR